MTNPFRKLAFSLVAACVVIASSIPTSAADRCRDCPFPMKIGDNKWLMPDSAVVIQIYEQQKMDASYMMSVMLVDARNNEVIATGSSRRLKFQRAIAMTLIDMQGRRIEGDIFWVDRAAGTLQARFSCADVPCALSGNL